MEQTDHIPKFAQRAAPPSAQLDRLWDDAMHQQYGAKRRIYPALERVVNNFSDRIGLAAPRFYITPSFPLPLGGTGPNLAVHVPQVPELGGALVATPSLLDLFHFTPHSPELPKPLQAAIAHEMGHLEQGHARLEFWRHTGPVGIGFMTAIASATLLEAVRRRGETHPAETPEQQLRASADELRRSVGNEPPPPGTGTSLKSTAIFAAEATVGALLGVAAKDLTIRHMSRRFEFDADKRAAELMGDAAPVIEFLERGTEGLRRTAQEHAKTFQKITFAEAYEAMTVYAHPTLEERKTALLALKNLSSKAASILR